MTQTDSLSRKIAGRIQTEAHDGESLVQEYSRIEQIIASELAEREQKVQAAIRALRIAELWLANSIPVSIPVIEPAGEKPLPLIRAALSGPGVK